MYITIDEASALLVAKGLTGQSANVLRSAIARGDLAAVKDGRCWKTTVEKLDAYELTLWKPRRVPSWGPLQRPPRTEAERVYEKAYAQAATIQLLTLLDESAAKDRQERREARVHLDAEAKAWREAQKAARKRK